MEEITLEIDKKKAVCLPDICVIGAGNVATHLARALSDVANVRQIVSRHTQSSSRLAEIIGHGCQASTDLQSLLPDADFYLIAVNDDCIADVVASSPNYPGIWAHTSGSVPIDVFASWKTRFGVFYPLQTFTRNVDVEMPKVPFFIEGSDRDATTSLLNLANKISASVEEADSQRRRLLHVAAVFACNYANLMWMEADEILKTGGLDIKCLMPLLEATLKKLYHTTPALAMTGPARRRDTDVIETHMRMLPADKREIYRLLSQTIIHKCRDEQDSL